MLIFTYTVILLVFLIVLGILMVRLSRAHSRFILYKAHVKILLEQNYTLRRERETDITKKEIMLENRAFVLNEIKKVFKPTPLKQVDLGKVAQK